MGTRPPPANSLPAKIELAYRCRSDLKTYYQLAELLGISAPYLSQLRHGGRSGERQDEDLERKLDEIIEQAADAAAPEGGDAPVTDAGEYIKLLNKTLDQYADVAAGLRELKDQCRKVVDRLDRLESVVQRAPQAPIEPEGRTQPGKKKAS